MKTLNWYKEFFVLRGLFESRVCSPPPPRDEESPWISTPEVSLSPFRRMESLLENLFQCRSNDFSLILDSRVSLTLEIRATNAQRLKTVCLRPFRENRFPRNSLVSLEIELDCKHFSFVVVLRHRLRPTTQSERCSGRCISVLRFNCSHSLASSKKNRLKYGWCHDVFAVDWWLGRSSLLEEEWRVIYFKTFVMHLMRSPAS